MIIKRNAFSNDVLKLSDKDIAALKEGKTLYIAGLTVMHETMSTYNIECDPNHSEK